MATVRCPSCEQALEVEDAYRDWTVRCPHCDGEFVPDAVGAARPRPRPRREEPADRDDYPDEDARDEYRRSARAEARRIVSAPATALEIFGWLGTVALVGFCALFLVLAIAMLDDPNANEEDALAFVFFAGFVGALGVPYAVAIVVGARKMRAMSSRGWALTAAILSVATFGVIGIALGVWALVALENPAVRAAYGLKSLWRPRRRRRAWD
jgi:hypothetical protein